MKRLFAMACAFTVCTLLTNYASAQKGRTATTYTTALGLGLDFGDNIYPGVGTLVGPSVKHFFDRTNVGKAEVLFGDHTTMLSLYYQYHGNIQNAAGLKWTLGLGGSANFFSYRGYNQTDFAFRPTVGLDYKITNVPLAFEFDWRPAIQVTHGSDFNAARFGFGFRYCF